MRPLFLSGCGYNRARMSCCCFAPSGAKHLLKINRTMKRDILEDNLEQSGRKLADRSSLRLFEKIPTFLWKLMLSGRFFCLSPNY